MKFFLPAILILCFSMAISGKEKANYYFDHYTIDNGLSQNTVTTIFQDSKGFMWFGTKNGLNRFDGYTFKVFSRGTQPHTLGNSSIYCIAKDSDNNLWIGTDVGAYIYNPHIDSFSFFDKELPSGGSLSYDISKIVFFQNQIWFKTGFDLFIYDPTKGFIHSELLRQLKALTRHTPSDVITDGQTIWLSIPRYGIVKYDGIRFTTLYNDSDFPTSKILVKNNKVYIGTSNKGLIILDLIKDQTRQLDLPTTDQENPLIHCLVEIDNQIWIGTENGIYIVTNGDITNIQHRQNDPYSLSNNAVYAIFQDQDKGIWIGSYFGGIDYAPRHKLNFEKYYPYSGKNSISGFRIREICQDKKGNLWIATEDAGLNHYDTHTNTFTTYSQHTPGIQLSYYNIQCLHLVNDQLWIGYFHKGIDVLDLRTKRITHYEASVEPTLNNNDIFSISSDQSGQIWIGTSTGVFLFDEKRKKFKKFDEVGTYYISDILQDSEGYIWFSSYNIGAIRFNPRTKSIKKFTYNPNDSTSICYSRITTMFEDQEGQLWFGSEDGGLCLYDKKSEKFKRITTNDGLPSNVVHKILEDKYHKLWISTNNGLANYDPETGSIQTYNTSNGLICKQFNYNSGIATDDGKLYFGNIRGLIAFVPEYFAPREESKHVVLTKFQIFNQDVEPQNEGTPILTQAIPYASQARLSYKDTSFNIEFSSLDYASKESNQYAYILEGVDKDWVYTNNRQVSYSNIHPGIYTFRVKVRNTDGSWDSPETSLEILVTPPWWKSPIAYCIYILLLLTFIYYVIKTYRQRMDRKMRIHQQEQEQKQQEEIYSAKIDFFTNIAHEIRTPLTLIKIPLESILNSPGDLTKKQESLQIIKRNTDRLYSLVSQLLDFRKTETKILKLNLETTSINTLISDTLIRFRPAMEHLGLQVDLSLPEKPVLASIDKEAVIKVLSNLFTNATKFAKSYIHISLTQNDEYHYIEIRVNNDGEKIPPEYREKIFEAFFQIHRTENNNHFGSGLGLSLAHSLIELHKGRIFVDEKAQDTSFVVQIPVGEQTQQLAAHTDTQLEKEAESNGQHSDNKTENTYSILIAEDNEELLNFIAQSLSSKYKVFKANNGMEALHILNQEKINIVISDIIMPIMDGIDLCNHITSDISTCHIPVILLTAKTNLDSKIKALKNGAAAYIEKPFSMEYLEAQISNLISNHKKLRKNFEQNPFFDSAELAHNKMDEKFLNMLTNVILQNIDKENFNVNELAREVNMSRTSLHRKLKDIYGLTPGDFIRVVRLKKAAELLQNGEYRINEISILVGFRSQSYFTKSFQKQFGVLPKDFLKNQASATK